MGAVQVNVVLVAVAVPWAKLVAAAIDPATAAAPVVTAFPVVKVPVPPVHPVKEIGLAEVPVQVTTCIPAEDTTSIVSLPPRNPVVEATSMACDAPSVSPFDPEATVVAAPPLAEPE